MNTLNNKGTYLLKRGMKMKVLGIILLCVLAVVYGPALIAAVLGGAFSLIVTLGVMLLVGGLVYFVAFLVAGSVFIASMVAVGALLVLTVGAWLPLLLVILLGIWLYKCTQTV
ncbi:hypothetical protein Ga0003345_1170 [Idiomarinaceae bacterium HL-53]|nr:hypothetical protein Ga0003345_1170 [Idiomarinaceae bacterium HL-53]